MKICIFSFTPLAAAPWELFKALKKYTTVEARLINATIGYPDGRIFPFDLRMNGRGGEADQVLLNSDLWHIHNYMHRELSTLRAGQPVVAQFHSLPRLGNWKELWDFTPLRYTIRQPLQEFEYQLPALPNLIDPDEYRPGRKGSKVRIAFAPSTRMPLGFPGTKGYAEVKRILKDVAGKRDVEIIWIEGVPYERNLEMKSISDILIDDVVTGNFHRTSLEGACFGCAVINKNNALPWVRADLGSLEERLLELVDNPGTLKLHQELARSWVESEWHAMDGVKEYVAAYKEALA
jgi:hypothetical protein